MCEAFPVAPFAGAWIEMVWKKNNDGTTTVAPFAGAWIEIEQATTKSGTPTSLPSRERELKCPRPGCAARPHRSLPSRERGLKWELTQRALDAPRVAPFAGAWIEIDGAMAMEIVASRRSLHGSVD